MKQEEQRIRLTIGFNQEEQFQLQQLKKYIHEEDLSKIVKFALSTAIHHLEFVTDTMVNPKYNVIFTLKRKTQRMDRKVY